MRITKRHLRRIIREEQAKVTKKYDDDSALTGDQDELPDALQKGIIDKVSGQRKKEKNESMRITKRQLRRIIREEAQGLIDVESPYDVEPVENVWGGCEDAGNLVLPIDHSKAAKSEPVTNRPEMLPAADPVLSQESFNRIRVYRGQKDLGRPHKVTPIVFERYYDAMVHGRLEEATDILEGHLDKRFPGWQDYEWLS